MGDERICAGRAGAGERGGKGVTRKRLLNFQSSVSIARAKPGTGERNTYAREVRVEKRLVCVFVPPRGASYNLYGPQDKNDEEACHGTGGGMRALDRIGRCQ
jgi:hypothetical protein